MLVILHLRQKVTQLCLLCEFYVKQCHFELDSFKICKLRFSFDIKTLLDLIRLFLRPAVMCGVVH